MADILKLSGLKIQKLDKTADSIEGLSLTLGSTTFTESSIATKDISGKIPSSQLPAIAITNVFVVADIAARDALTVEEGDVAKVTDAGSGFPKTFIYDGSIWIEIEAGGSSLDALSDVAISMPIMGQSLVYDGVSFTNQTLSYSLDSLTDVTLSAPMAGQVLVYDGMNFVNSTASLDSLSDAMISMPIMGQSLVYDGVNFTNQTLSYSLDSLTDVTLSAPMAGQVLVYDGMNFVNGTPSLDSLSDAMISMPIMGQSLVYDGVNFTNQTLSYSLDSLTDVTLSAPMAGQVIVYDGMNFVNGTPSLDSLSDAMVSMPIMGQSLVYDGVNFTNQTLSYSLDSLTDVTLSAPMAGQVLAYDGMNFVNQVNSLDNLSDVTLSAPSAGQVLAFDGANFINQTNSLDNLSDVSISAPSTGEYLRYDGFGFINSTIFSDITSYFSSGLLNTSIIPDADEAYDLGSATNKFKDLYLSGSTIYIGGSSIAVDPVVGLVVGGQATNKIELVAGEAISAGQFVYVKSGDGDVFVADNALPMSRPEIALMYFSEASYSADDVGAFSKPGQELAIAGTKGDFGYLGTNGAITTTAPTASGSDVILLGFWKSSTVFVFNPQYLATN